MKFSKRAFTEWLESKTALTRVGKPEDTGNCPLCEFMRDQGAKRVLTFIARREIDGKSYPNPEWARKFQLAACEFVKTDTERQITAKRALSFL